MLAKIPGDIVDKKCSNSATVVGSGDGPEVLLACCVPYLQFDIFVVDRYGFCSKFYSNGDIMGNPSFVLDELKHDA